LKNRRKSSEEANAKHLLINTYVIFRSNKMHFTLDMHFDNYISKQE